ncbi:MAG: SRPBCC family protein [Anaerolineae bacterium]|nr:SRPBCC family protein [Anaerolineae bacterium]
MSRIEEQIEIAAGATSVFRFCHDMDRRPDWDERVSRAKLLTPKPLRRGSVIRFDTRPTVGAVFSWEGEMVEYHFPSSSKVKVVDVAPSSSFVSGSETWRFSSSGGTAGITRFTLTWDYQPRGIIGRVVDALFRRASTRHAINQSLKNLKGMMEEQT